MKRVGLLIAVFILVSSNTYAQFSIYLDHKYSFLSERITALRISTNGRFMAVGTAEGAIYVVDLPARRMIHELSFHRKKITAFSFDSNNTHLVSGSEDRKVAIWDLYTGKLQKVIKTFKVHYLALNPDDRILAVCGKSKYISLFEFPSGERKGDLKGGHKKNIIFLSYNLNGDEVVSVGKDSRMIFWNPSQLKLVRNTELSPNTINGSGIEIYSAQTSADKYMIGIGYQEMKLAKGGRGMIFKHNTAFYEWKTGKEIEILERNNQKITSLAISPDKRYIITDNSTLRNRKISFWNLQQGIIEQNYSIDGIISAIEISENGSWLATAFTPQDKGVSSSFVNVLSLSGIDGFERFNFENPVQERQLSGFGGSIKITTPREPMIGLGERKKLAVVYFDHLGIPGDVAKTATYLLESKLGNSPQIDLIERNQIESVLNELKVQMSGLTTSDAVEIGRQLNCEFIILGSINKLGNLLILTVKLVNVETAKIEGTREVQCSNATIENIADMVNALAPTITAF